MSEGDEIFPGQRIIMSEEDKIERDMIARIARAVTDIVLESLDQKVTSMSRLSEAVKAQEREIEALTEIVTQLWFSKGMPGDRRAEEQEKLWHETIASRRAAEKNKLEEC